MSTHFRALLTITLMSLVLAACTSQAPEAPTPTPPAVARVLATVFISPTPNAQQAEATRQASSPTVPPPSPTVDPTETPYIGIFVGEAQRDTGIQSFTEPVFGVADAPSAPEATANTAACAISIDTPYAQAWAENSVVSRRMGCPIQAGFGFFGTVQIFENGVMYRRPENNTIWAILPQAQQGDYFVLEDPPELSTVGILPDAGFQLPTGAFADMWLAVEGLRGAIGFAQTASDDVAMGLQRYENGTFLFDATSEQVYALIVDGTVHGPFLAPEDAVPGVNAPITERTPEATAEVTEESGQ